MDWKELTLKIVKITFESLPLLIWPAGVFATLFYFRKPLLSIFEKANGIKIKSPFANIELELPIETKVKVVDNIEKINSEIDKNAESKPSDTTVNWIVELIEAIESSDIIGAEGIFERYKEQERNPSELYKNKAYFFEIMYIHGNKQDFIQKLEKHISEAKSEQEKIVSIISYTRVIEVTKQYHKAINILDEFIKNSSSEEVKSAAINRISECYIANKEPEKAKKLIIDILPDFQDRLIISSLYVNLSKVEGCLGNKKISALCLDKAVEFNPTDQETLFESAFQSSENGMSSISICNYNTLIGINKKHSSALNNIAICAENEKLSLISIKYYKDAAEQSNSLAMINQGFRLLDAGFSREAEDIAKKVLTQESPHQNVHSLLTSIHERREKEHKEWIECQSKADSFQKKTRKFITAYTKKPKISILDSIWMLDNDITTTATIDKESQIEIKWQEEIPDSTSKYECSLTGKITNSAFEGLCLKFVYPKIEKTILGSKYEGKYFNFYGYLDETENVFTISDVSSKDSDIILKRANS